MQVTNILIAYQLNYNGCTVFVNDGLDSSDVEGELSTKMEQLQDAVIEEAYNSVITEGRYEGTFIGDVTDLEEFAFKKAVELFGEGIELVFEEDDLSAMSLFR